MVKAGTQTRLRMLRQNRRRASPALDKPGSRI
jgi:hypothetical protein